jgi:threonine synthase
MSGQVEAVYQRCINPACGKTWGVGQTVTACPACGELLDVVYDWDRQPVPKSLAEFERKYASRRDPLHFSGVWRFRELLNFAQERHILSIGEGQTLLRNEPVVSRYAGLPEAAVFLQYEGLNPSGSFKDNGMTAAFAHARMVGARHAACASTGNTSASLAAFAAATQALPPEERMVALVFVGSGRIALGKLAQSLDFGARTVQIPGRFDDAMRRVQEVSRQLGIYIVNSVNPFRLEGQKTIMFRILEGLRWEVPDWIVCPGGNLGNSSAFGKAFHELKELGLIRRLPRLAVVNASGADTLDRLYNDKRLRWNGGRMDRQAVGQYYGQLDAAGRQANTIATAIEINRPVNLSKCLRALEWLNGVVLSVSDQEILDAKAIVGRTGLGCEPASAAGVAGLKQLVARQVVGKDQRVVCVITGHQLKAPDVTVGYHSEKGDELAKQLERYGVVDAPFANRPVQVKNDLDEILRLVRDECERTR